VTGRPPPQGDHREATADLVVLGAGPAGLAAAWRAALAGRSVTVVERADRVGGLAASFDVGGVRVDHGSHRLHPATPPQLLADLRALLGADLQLRPRNGRLQLAGRWVSFPLRPAELVTGVPPSLAAGIARDAVTGPLRRRRTSAETFADVLRAGIGPALYDALYAPYAVKLWGLPGERIAAEQARRRVTADTPWKVLHRVLRSAVHGASAPGRVFYYPRRGFGQIADALAEAATAAGTQIRLGTTAVSLSTGSTVSVGLSDGSRLRARHVFSTVPLPVLGRITQPPPPEGALQAAARLRFRAMVLVYLVQEGGRFSPYDAHYLPGPHTPVTRISEPANYRMSAEDPPDRSVVCAEIPCAVDDPVWTARDDELAALVDETLARTGLPAVRRAGVVVRRLPHVYPVYELGYEAHLAALDAWARGLPGVTTFGRLGLFAHDNTHHALAMAYDAVGALTSAGFAGGFDDAAWAAARARFASHVVED
jgi:protoporphyrinogen oxidase